MRIIVLFNLKSGVAPETYQAWVRGTDVPMVRALPSIDGFEVAEVTGLLGGEGAPPYQYVEVIDVTDMDRFGADVASEAMQRVSREFREFADDPVFLLTRDLGEGL